jgi:hypothetical protein
MSFWNRLAWLSCVALLSPVAAEAASECPSAVSGRGSYVIERSGSSRTEVFYGDGAVIRTVMKSGGRVLLETTQHEGLFQVDRLERGQRAVYKPKSDLAKLFPLKPKQKMTVLFDATEGNGSPYLMSVKLEVVGTGSLAIGGCKYDVIKLDHNETRRGQAWAPYIDYYAPELKLVIGKEYRDGTLIKFDAIAPVP